MLKENLQNGSCKMNAYEWGIKHKSCKSALELRKRYKNQKEWWKVCNRGDWLLWQLNQLPDTQYPTDTVHEILITIVNRTITKYVLHCEVPSVEQWAVNWLNGTDRSYELAMFVAESTVWLAGTSEPEIRSAKSARSIVWSAAKLATKPARVIALVIAETVSLTESKLQADDIHSVIPEWIWD